MQVPVHLAISWLVAHRLPELRDRRLVTWSGVAPDLDALSLLGGAAAYSKYHHVLTHGFVAAVAMTVIATIFARQRWKVFFMSLLTFHLHLICDLLGSGAEWPIVYFYPFSRHEYFTPYGWPLRSPQNAVIAIAALAITVWVGIARGRTFAEAFLPARGDAAVVKALRDMYQRYRPSARPEMRK